MSKIIIEPASKFVYSEIPEDAPYWVTHTRFWVSIVEKSFPHIKGFIASDSHAINSKSSFLPIYKIKRPFNKISWLSIPYATISDPIIRKGSSIDSFFNSLINKPLINKQHLEIRTIIPPTMVPKFGKSTGYFNHQIYLDRDEKEIFKSFHRTAVQVPIRKSLSAGVTLKLGSKIQDVEVFYKLYAIMRKQIGLPPQPFCFFKNMWNELYKSNNVELLMAEQNSNIIATIWVLKNNWLYSFEYLGRCSNKDKLYGSHFLYWQGIKRALKDQFKTLSFARIYGRNVGLNQFKLRWGTVSIPYYDLIYPSNITENRESRNIYKIIKKCSKFLPTQLFRLLGEVIYRFI